MGKELKDFERPGQTCVLHGFRKEPDGFIVPQGIKWGTYYTRHATSLEHVMPFVKVKGVAVQAGGHLGAYPRWLARHFNRVYTFEVDPRLHAALALNTLGSNVTMFPVALGYQSRVGKHGGHVISLDTLNLSRCDLLCLDIEGGEHLALCGAFQTIETHRPVILVEEAPIEHNQPEWYAAYQRACDLLRSQDYELVEGTRCGPDRIWLSRG